MNHPTNPPWPWPTREEGDQFAALLGTDGALTTEVLRPEAVHTEHPDGRSLWATKLDLREDARFAPRGLSDSLIYPVVADNQEELEKRVTVLVRDLRAYGMNTQRRSPLRRDPYLDAEIEELQWRSQNER